MLKTDKILQEAVALHQQHRLAEARDLYMDVLMHRPDDPNALHLLGVIEEQSGRHDRALELIKRAVAIAPNEPIYLNNLGSVYRSLGLGGHAKECYRSAIKLDPTYADPENNLGNVLLEEADLEPAYWCFQRALNLNPRHAGAHLNLGRLRQRRMEDEEALKDMEKAIALQPDYCDAQVEYLHTLRQLARITSEECVTGYRALVEHFPGNELAHWHLGMELIATGELIEGFKEFDWRWKSDIFFENKRRFDEPRWNGSDPAGKRILVYAEQGYGDALQFVRFVPPLIARGAHVFIGCRPPLRPLFRRIPGVVEVIEKGMPEFDYHVPLMSMPIPFKTTLDTIPSQPYLNPEPDVVARWKNRLAELGPELKVGITWGGSPTHANDKNRSIGLARLAPLANIPNVRFVNLQLGRALLQIDQLPAGMQLVDHTSELITFLDTANLVAALDLVITVDTSVCHLAGGLGVPTWVLLPEPAEFRWMNQREDTPWYPTTRLFRQPQRGNWEAVMDRVAAALRPLAAAHR